eukprot:gene9130-10777_t
MSFLSYSSLGGNTDTNKLASQKCATYVDKLAELEAAIEKRKANIRFYTPSAPIIGLNSADVLDHQPEQYMEQVVDVELNPDEDVEEEMNEYAEELSESEYLDAMDELEDSTEA